MTYVEENTRKLEELKKLPYEELRIMEKEILNNPNSTRADIINICVARGEKGVELGLTCTIDEVEREFKIGKYKTRVGCERRFKTDRRIYIKRFYILCK